MKIIIPKNALINLATLTKSIGLVFLTLFTLTPVNAAMDIAGDVKFTRGIVAAQNELKKHRMLGKGEDVFIADNIQTAEKSFVILSFVDGGKITIRPNSSFSILEYLSAQGSENQEENIAGFELHKGGVRVNTGDVAAGKSNKYKIKTKKASVSAKDAEYSVRLCEQDCQKESDASFKPEKQKHIIAYIVKLEGNVEVKRANKPIQSLVLHAPLYEKDNIITGKNSYAVIAYRDEGRMTLQENTEFKVTAYKYTKNPQADKAVFKLIKGGLRVLTGKIGKINKQNFAVNTPVATIGIRGTGFDLLCQGNGCQDAAGTSRHCVGGKCIAVMKLNDETLAGLHTYVWENSIVQTNEAGSFELSAPDANYIANKKVEPREYVKLPTFFRMNKVPRPDLVDISKMPIFTEIKAEYVPVGLYVEVYQGNVIVKNSDKKIIIQLNTHEVAYIDGQGDAKLLDKSPYFLVNDPYFLSSNEVDLKNEVGIYSLLIDKYSMQTKEDLYQCVLE